MSAAGPAIARLVPVHVEPPAQPPGRLALFARFVRNPLRILPQAAYQEDAVPLGERLLVVTSPELIRTVLLDQRDSFHKLSQIRLLGPLLGRGILTSEGAEWKWQRQASAPMFRRQDLIGFVPAFVRAASALVDRWRSAPQGAVQAVDRQMTQATFDVISATLLPSANAAVGSAIEQSTGQFQRSGSWAQLYAMLNAPRWLPRPGRAALALSAQAMRSSTAELLRERRAMREGEAPDDLLHRLMVARDPESGHSMNDEQLVDNLLTFYLAGHETTAKALTWTLYLLSRSPRWSARLEEEIAQVTAGGPVEASHMDRLVLVQQVIKESMRLYPPVPLMSRQAVADTSLGGHAVPAGSSVVMPIYAIHRHAKRWQDANAFDPERFAADREAQIPRYQYMPFGAGPRICIGMAFAMIEATVMLATFLQHARFEPAGGPEPQPVARVTLLPGGGMPLRVRVR